MAENVDTTNRNTRATMTGRVVSTKMKDTVTVVQDITVVHPKYHKRVKGMTKLHAHDPGNTCGVGDLVLVRQTRPISKTKCWRVVRIVEKAK
jgi:small subunit ribosomal protein S17